MNHNIVDRAAVGIVPLNRSRARVPDLDRAVLRAGDEPLALTMEGDARDVAMVALEDEKGRGAGGADIVELHVLAASCGEEALVG